MATIRNVDQLRDAIDTGKTGDKVAHPDPAVAPLGTDAKAGGASPTSQEVALDVSRLPRTSREPGHGQALGVVIYFAAVALVFVAVIAIVIFATSGHTG